MKLKCRGTSFTLVEMLVGIAIFSLLVLLLFAIMGQETKLWRQQSSAEQSFREARAALSTLSRDMTAAVSSTNTAWFYASTNQLAFLTTLPDVAQNTNYNNGDVCAVGYSWEWGTNNAGGVSTNMSLYRYVAFSGPTYTNYILPASPPSVQMLFGSADSTDTVRELLARNISQFSFVCYTNSSTGPQICPNPTVLPNMIAINMAALNDRAAALLTTQAQWLNTTSPIVQQNQESFALRVRPQAP